jgi:hypothetical protein
MNAKDRARVFMFVCIGMLALSIVYTLGARSVMAQASGNAFVCMTSDFSSTGTNTLYAITSSGEVYKKVGLNGWVYWGPVIAAVSADQSSYGAVKQQYR